jgi:hypothetical protein
MASLVCWASGLLDVMMDKDVSPDSGPVVLAHGTAGKLRALMTAHAEYRDKLGWYVPGTRPIPKDEAVAATIQRDNMTPVIAFNKKLILAQARVKGRRFYEAEKQRLEAV